MLNGEFERIIIYISTQLRFKIRKNLLGIKY